MSVSKRVRRRRNPMREPPEDKLRVEIPPERKQAIAASLLGEDRYPDRKIGEIVGVSRRTICKWKTIPEFQLMVKQAAEDYIKQFKTAGLANKSKRLAVLNDVHDRLTTAVKERGDDPSMKDVPGGETGMVARTYRGVGKGKNFRLISEYKIDTPVIRAILDIHESVREELGDNKQRMELTGPDGEALQPPRITVQFVRVEKIQRHDTDGGAPILEGHIQEEDYGEQEEAACGTT
jgi:hypothetical protein